jgi:hypothetical protein
VKHPLFPLTSILALLALRAFAAEPGAADLDFFEKKVRPLLAERCLECHSAEKKVKGGLLLDSREGWAKGGDTGPAIEPGKPEESLLIQAVRWHDKDLQMPPKKRLSADEVAVLEQWIKMGAPDPRKGAVAVKKQTGLTLEEGRKFWSYIPPRKPAPPAVKDAAWPRGDIDRFILAKLEAKALAPAADASPQTLARRLYYNLIGLPPTPAQSERFVQSAIPDPQSAIAHAVDELLASPRFGETWGRHWLDVARFAESSGGGRTLLFKDAWRYRDYVIEAFNADHPFDQFIREQIAGDLLPAADSGQRRRQLTATAFLALGPTNYEEQDKQQLRFDVIDEQLDTIGRAILGQTIGCARCHDHKFDPIPQRDYYALAGIFASTRTLLSYKDNVARWIDTPLPLEGDQEEKLQTQEARVAALKTELESAKAELSKAKAALTKAGAAAGRNIAVADLPGIVVDDADAKTIGDWEISQRLKGYVGDGYRTDLGEGKGTKTLTFTPKFPQSGRYEVRFAYIPNPNRDSHVPIIIFHANGEEKAFVDETLPPPIDGRFVSLGTFRFEKDGAGFVLVSNEGTSGHVVADVVQFISEEESAAALGVAAASANEKGPAQSVVKGLAARVKDREAAMKALLEAGPRRPVAMTVSEDEKAGDTQICIRGLVHQRGAQVPRGLLRVMLDGEPPVFSDQESGRRQLADWLASPQNPLTARVLVNRVWHWLFGAGLVRTTDNFGTTGEVPSHPELLDHLALRFIEEGWSVKKLIREIVLSRNWQLAAVNPESRLPTSETPDPDNRLLGHANRRRLDAEEIRDAILAVSGELRLELGGPNIAGAGEINANDTGAQNIEYKYEFKDARRSVYTPAFRNKRLELFEVFDFGDINAPLGRRNASTVAPQALYLLNHPFIIAQSRLAAERALASSTADDERLTSAFRSALGRAPTPQERLICARFLTPVTDEKRRLEAWAQVYQSLFASVDFRYLE